MRITLLLGVLATLMLSAATANAQAYPPVQPDQLRGPRNAICVDFDRTKANVCNTNPSGVRYRTSTDCRNYRENGDGTVTILCSEDHPDFYPMIRKAAVARTCGENGILCIGAYFDREHERCAYRVVPESWNQPGPYDIRISDLYSEWRIRPFLAGTAGARDYESKHRRQERYALYNASHPQRASDPCRAS